MNGKNGSKISNFLDNYDKINSINMNDYFLDNVTGDLYNFNY